MADQKSIRILEARVLLTNGTDLVTLRTELPCPFTKEGLPSQPPLDLRFDATYDTGIEYCRNVLGLDPKVVNTR